MSYPPGAGDGEKRKLVTQDTLDSSTLSQTPSVSSEDPLSPVVRCKHWVNLHQADYSSGAYDCSLAVNLWNEDILQLYCSCFFNVLQLQSLDQAQASCLHLMMSRIQLRGCPRFPFRSMCLQSAPERGFLGYSRPCCHQPKQYEKPSRVFKGWDAATVLICFIFLELGDWMISVSNVCMLNMMTNSSHHISLSQK